MRVLIPQPILIVHPSSSSSLSQPPSPTVFPKLRHPRRISHQRLQYLLRQGCRHRPLEPPTVHRRRSPFSLKYHRQTSVRTRPHSLSKCSNSRPRRAPFLLKDSHSNDPLVPSPDRPPCNRRRERTCPAPWAIWCHPLRLLSRKVRASRT